jgi:hypothetical protein
VWKQNEVKDYEYRYQGNKDITMRGKKKGRKDEDIRR